MHKVHPKKKRY